MARDIDGWRGDLRRARESLGFSREELARRSGVSPGTLRRWEDGSRHPRPARLQLVLDALRVDRGLRNRMMLSAGFAPDGMRFHPSTPSLYYTVEEAAQELESYVWPAFALNEMMELLVANGVAQRLWGVDLRREFTDPVDRNMLSVASNPRFADRVANWEEAVGVILAGFKGHTRGPEDYDSPGPYFNAVLERFLAGDQQYVTRFLDLWERTEPLKLKIHWSYPVVWEEPGVGRISFRCLVCAANEPDGLSFNHWIPDDADSWARLERLLSQPRGPRNL